MLPRASELWGSSLFAASASSSETSGRLFSCASPDEASASTVALRASRSAVFFC